MDAATFAPFWFGSRLMVKLALVTRAWTGITPKCRSTGRAMPARKDPRCVFDGIDCLDRVFCLPWQMASGESFP